MSATKTLFCEQINRPLCHADDEAAAYEHQRSEDYAAGFIAALRYAKRVLREMGDVFGANRIDTEIARAMLGMIVDDN